MNLLPQTHSEFSSAEYWERFFKTRGTKAFEWYGEYIDLCSVLHKYIKTSDNILVLGCGNSQLSADLYDVGYHGITNIDISDVVIKQMNEKNKGQRSEMSFLRMDMLQMSFEDNTFSVTLDKGTLDALMTDSSDEVAQKVNRMFSEIDRVLRMGGRYICISLCQEHILRKAVTYFNQLGWMIRVHQIQPLSKDEGFPLPVFAFVFTKFKKMPNFTPIVELSLSEDGGIQRIPGSEELITAVQSIQQFAVMRDKINKGSSLSEQAQVELFEVGCQTPRFTIHIVDGRRQKRPEQKFAVFIVPEGRESEWLFSSDEGRKQISLNAQFERLAMVSLHRDHKYESLDAIKNELSGKVLELSPPGMPSNVQVPFLTIGEDIGKRTIRYRGTSELSGDFVVEDVEKDGVVTCRKLVFLKQQNIVQSEARLVTVKKKGKKTGSLKVDPTDVQCGYQTVMEAGLAFIDNFHSIMESKIDVLLIGLGGGGLPCHIHTCFKNVSVDVVELDPAIVTVAKDWFDVKEDDRLKIHTADGLTFILDTTETDKRYHAIMIDVNTCEPGVGLSGPPRSFVELDMLTRTKQCLHPEGVLILNFVARDRILHDEILSTLQTVFHKVFIQALTDDVNEVLFCLPETNKTDCILSSKTRIPSTVKSSLEKLGDCVKTQTKSREKSQELIMCLNSLKLS